MADHEIQGDMTALVYATPWEEGQSEDITWLYNGVEGHVMQWGNTPVGGWLLWEMEDPA